VGKRQGTLEPALLDISASDPEERTEGKYVRSTAEIKEWAVTTLESLAAVQWDLDRGRKGLTAPHEIQQG